MVGPSIVMPRIEENKSSFRLDVFVFKAYLNHVGLYFGLLFLVVRPKRLWHAFTHQRLQI